MEENSFNEGPDENSSSSGQSGTGHKRMRIDYSIFRTDVARLQQNLDDLESDLKQHSMQVPNPNPPYRSPHPPPNLSSPSLSSLCASLQVQEKLALILRALDEAPMAEEPSAGVAEAAHRMQSGLDSGVVSAGGLSSACLPQGQGLPMSNNSSTGSLNTASTAAGSAASASPSLSGDGAPASGGGGGALGSSRDLAAAYLAATGHHNSEEGMGSGSGSSGGGAAGSGLQPSATGLNQFGSHQRAIAAAGAGAGLPSHFNASIASSALNASLAASYAAATGGLPGGLPGAGANAGAGAPGGAPGGRWCDGWGAPQLSNSGATASSLPLSGGAPNSAAALAHQLALQRAELLAPAGARLGLQGLYGSRSLDAQREPAAAQS